MAGSVPGLIIPVIQSVYRRVLSGGSMYLIFACIFFALLLAGVASGVHALFIAGTRHSYGTYREIPVAILISTYIFFVVASTGICLISSLGHIFGVRNLLPVAKRSVYLSIITILSGFLVIGLEIENPLRMAIYNIVSPNFSSNIWWMGTLYGFAMIFLIVEFIFLIRGIHQKAVIAGLFGVIAEIAANTNLGGVFAMMHGRPYWYGPYFPFYFLLSALATGCAFIIFFTIAASVVNKVNMDEIMQRSLSVVGKLAVLFLIIIMIFTGWKLITTSVGDPLAIEAMQAMLAGPYAFNFWGIEIMGGMIIPLVLFFISGLKNMKIMFAAALLMIFSTFFMRLDMVIAGQIVPLYFELGVVEYSRLHTYTPTVHEILVVLGGAGFCGLAFMLGEKIFNGFADEKHTSELTPVQKDEEEAEETV